jgi:peptidoglycan hydrolase-like protein with peptidoglycan-binding domain
MTRGVVTGVLALVAALPTGYAASPAASPAARPAARPAAMPAAAVDAAPGIRLTGGDISWPNCPRGMGIPSRRSEGKPLPLRTASFAVLGLTNGPGFTPNPCLADHVAWAKATGVWTGAYAMTTFPTAAARATYGGTGPWSPATSAGLLRNTGYAQGLFNVGLMRAAGLQVPMVWVDVEPYPVAPWSRSRGKNRDVLRGAVRAYEDSGLRVGFYSYANGWRAVVGAWRKPAYPLWVPVGHVANGLAVASARCRAASFSGGEVLLAQWVQSERDRDVTCPSLVGRVAGMHPLTTWLDRRLHKGSRGPAVRALQGALGARVDGIFGKQTKAALVRFQRRHGR